MPKMNAYVIISGNLLENEKVLNWLKKLTIKYHVSVCIGGGEQINQAFSEREWKNKFGPMGRICDTLEQRQVCEKILKENQAIIQDLFDEKGISAEVKIPFGYDGDVLCPINNDHMVSRVYNGHDKIYRLTTKAKEKEKKLFFEAFTEACQKIGKGRLNKLEVKGF